MNLEQACKILQNLDENVPKPMPKATDKDIVDIECKIGFDLPQEIKFFLKEASHITYDLIEPIHVVLPSSPDFFLNVRHDAKQMGVPVDWIPICEDNSNFYCYTPDGTIRYWDHNGVNDESWPNLATWIKEVWIEGN